MPEDKLYCGNCKAELTPMAKACPKCGADPHRAVNFCTLCGEPITNPNAIICTKCGASLKGGRPAAAGGARSGAPGEVDPIIATVISLVIPFLGLYFVWPEDKKTTAILYTVAGLAADAAVFVIGFILTFFLIGVCCFFVIPVIHLAAALYTYNEAMKITGGKTLF
ncbi:double zinc ribbon domain-containing protein [Methanocella sp. MCL-LM]|uniref:double zinc ribbon domain-containing protein n=1 Tax=Methanocella sp. MCL-LM TaxID=3412035 RepID=UPI003C75ADB2